MAGRRMLHANICESRKLSAVSLGAEVLYYRILTQVDDGGNFYFDAHIMWGRCFPLRRGILATEIEKWRDELIAIDLLSEYIEKEEKYIHFNGFEKFQYLRSDRQPDFRYPRCPFANQPETTGKPTDNQVETAEQPNDGQRLAKTNYKGKESKLVASRERIEESQSPEQAFLEAKRKYHRIVGKSIGSLGLRDRDWSGLVARHGAELVIAAIVKWATDNKDFLKKCGVPISHFLKNSSDYLDLVSVEREQESASSQQDQTEQSTSDGDDFLRQCGVSEEMIAAQNKKKAAAR